MLTVVGSCVATIEWIEWFRFHLEKKEFNLQLMLLLMQQATPPRFYQNEEFFNF